MEAEEVLTHDFSSPLSARGGSDNEEAIQVKKGLRMTSERILVVDKTHRGYLSDHIIALAMR